MTQQAHQEGCGCTTCADGSLFPEAYVVHLSGTCCRCAEAQPEIPCGCSSTKGDCESCGSLNQSIVVRRISKSDTAHYYSHTFEKTDFTRNCIPCGTKKLTLKLTRHEAFGSVRYSACVVLSFEDHPSASWYRPRITDCCNIGPLRRHTGSGLCCWPKSIWINGTPTPDYVPPQPEWKKGNPDDLNDAPYWPTLDIDLMEDSPEAPVRYSNGELQIRMKDIGSDGFGVPWGHTRIYSNRLSNSYDFGNGYNWLVHEWPQLVRRKTDPKEVKAHHRDTDSEPTGCTLVLLRGTRNAVWFDEFRPSVGESCCRTWRARFGAKHRLIVGAEGSPFLLVAPNGHKWKFNGFTPKCFETSDSSLYKGVDSRLDGKFTGYVGPGGPGVQDVVVAYKDGRVDEMMRGSEKYKYKYFEKGENCGRLQHVTLSRDNKELTRGEYLYYTTSARFGQPGDLKMAARQMMLDGGWKNIDIHYYRYDKDSHQTYCQGMLRTVVGPEAVRRLVKRQVGRNELNRIASSKLSDLAGKYLDNQMDRDLAMFADLVIQYDDDRRVKSLTMNGGGRTHTFKYEEGWKKIDHNLWHKKCVETRPDKSTRTVFSTFIGQTVLTDLSGEGKSWAQYRIYDPKSSRLLLHSAPSAIRRYTEVPPPKPKCEQTTCPPQYVEPEIVNKVKTSQEVGSLSEISGITVLLRATGEGLFQVLKDSQDDWIAEVWITNNLPNFLKPQKLKLANFEYDPYELRVWSQDGNCRAIDFVALKPLKKVDRRVSKTQTATTEFRYSWFSDAGQYEQRNTMLPDVPLWENGRPGRDVIREVYNQHGYRELLADERGVITKTTFDIAKGVITALTEDANTAGLRTPDGFPVSKPEFGTHVTTDYESDDLGRIIKMLSPEHEAILPHQQDRADRVRSATWLEYRDVEGEVVTMSGYSRSGERMIAPIQLTRIDRAGRVVAEIEAVASTSIRPNSVGPIAQKSWCRWTQHHFDDQDKHTWTRVYHDIPGIGAGTQSKNYDQVRFCYDALYRQEVAISPGGTVTQQKFDPRGLVLETKVGSVTVGPTLPGQCPLFHAVPVVTNEYDDGQSGGNGNLTKAIQHIDGSETRVWKFGYNWRNQQISMRRPIENQDVKREFNDLDQVVEEEDVPRGYAKFPSVDVRGRVFKITEEFRDTDSGSSYQLHNNVWRDSSGNAIAIEHNNGLASTKIAYDAFGRPTEQFLTCTDASGDGSTHVRIATHEKAKLQPSDIVFEQTETTYDEVGNAVCVTTKRRSPAASPAQGIAARGRLASEHIAPQCRVSHAAFWHDPLGRTIAVANYGANGSPTMTRLARVPLRSDTVLVSHNIFNNRGELTTTAAPDWTVGRTVFDDAGRPKLQTENFSLNPFDTSATRSTEFEYTPDGQLQTIKAHNKTTGTQVTRYRYGGQINNNPSIKLSTLVRETVDPEGRVSAVTYNRQQEPVTRTDANQTKHQYTYDPLGRVTKDSIVSWQNIDSKVLEIAYGFDNQDRLRFITSYDRPTITTSSAAKLVDRVERYYNHFGQITQEFQLHGKLPGANSRMRVRYAYDTVTVGQNRIIAHAPRLSGVAFPHTGDPSSFETGSPFVAHFGYNDRLSSHTINRVAYISEGRAKANFAADRVLSGFDVIAGDKRAEYTYFGASNLYRTSLPETDNPQDNYSHPLVSDVRGGGLLSFPSADESYPYLDRFDRLLRMDWKTDSFSQDEMTYAYDRLGQRTARQNILAALRTSDPTLYLGEVYDYDGLSRLRTMQRGLVGRDQGQLVPRLTNRSLRQQWDLDKQDNWNRFREFDGRGNITRDERRFHDQSNRVGLVHPSGGRTGYLAFDANGNMTSAPMLPGTGNTQSYDYDSWNRLVRVRNNGTVVAEYDYDGLGRRTVEHRSGLERHFYYSHDWQLLQERVTEPGYEPRQWRIDKQYVWGVGTDNLVLRDWDTTLDGKPDQRLYALHDGNLNTTSLFDPSLDANGKQKGVVERMWYDPYGQPLFMDGDFKSTPQSASSFNVLYGGYYYDQFTGLYHVRNRVYHPKYGRWLQTDPSGFNDSFNLYQYGLSSPVTNDDPMGAAVETAWDVASLVMGIYSLQGNVREGNVGWAILDSIGILADLAAILLPIVPGGAGMAIKALRGVGFGIDAAGASKATFNAIRYAGNISDTIKVADSAATGVQFYDAYLRGDKWGMLAGGTHLGIRGVQASYIARQFGRNPSSVSLHWHPRAKFTKNRELMGELTYAEFGHVGVSFGRGSLTGDTIFGFTPIPKGDRSTFLSRLLDRQNFAGKISDDTEEFAKMLQHQFELGTEVFTETYAVNRHVHRAAMRMLGKQQNSFGIRYRFPSRGVPFPPHCANCATFLDTLKLPNKFPSGYLSRPEEITAFSRIFE